MVKFSLHMVVRCDDGGAKCKRTTKRIIFYSYLDHFVLVLLRSFINICIKCTLCYYLDVPFHLVLCISTFWIYSSSLFFFSLMHSVSFDVRTHTHTHTNLYTHNFTLLSNNPSQYINGCFFSFGLYNKRKQQQPLSAFFINATLLMSFSCEHFPYF